MRKFKELKGNSRIALCNIRKLCDLPTKMRFIDAFSNEELPHWDIIIG